MKNIYMLFAMDEEPDTRVLGEFGHRIVGVYESVECALKVAEDCMRYHSTLLIIESPLGGPCFGSKEVFKWGWDHTHTNLPDFF